MGGRGCARNPVGSVVFKTYYTKAKFEVQIGEKSEKLSVVFPDVQKTGGSRSLPLESDKPSEKYVETDRNGIIKKIRIYDNDCKMSLDIDLHPTRTGGEPVVHYHKYKDSENQEMKKKTGRSSEHLNVHELPEDLKPLVPCLGKPMSDMKNFRERQ